MYRLRTSSDTDEREPSPDPHEPSPELVPAPARVRELFIDALLAPLHCPPVRHLSRLSGCAQALGDKNGAESGIISEPSITTGAVWMAEGVRSLSRTIKEPLGRAYATPLGRWKQPGAVPGRPIVRSAPVDRP